ncbi:MAG: RDD family protein [Planctomycetes bacterium]|nr:RDD family protein [Planctomycetota bacterium]
MAKLVVETPEGVEIQIDLAGVGSRSAAALLDLLIFAFAATVVLLLGLVAVTSLSLRSAATDFLIGMFVGGTLLVGLAYPFVWHVRANGQTPGKMLVGIRVTAADGAPAGAVAHLLRSLVLLADLFPAPAPIGLVLAAVTPRHTRLGDLAAGTIVLRVPPGARAPEPWPRDTWSGLPTRELPLEPRLASALSAEDLAFLGEVVRRAEGLAPGARAELERRVVDLYRSRLGLPGAPPPTVSSEALRELFLFAREHAGRTPS